MLDVFAHAFGQSFSLPVPIWLTLYVGASVVIFTFVVASLLLPDIETGVVEKYFSKTKLVNFLQQKGSGAVFRVLTVALFALAIIAALLGTTNPDQNFAPTFFWIVFWVALPFSSLLFGNFWENINPWSAIYGWVKKIKEFPITQYPAAWGLWPAVIFYALFTWFELASGIGYLPRVLGVILLTYSAIMLAGALKYGFEWLRQAEVFTVLARLVGAISIFGYDNGTFRLQTPGAGLMKLQTNTPGLLAFVGVFISGVSYDGFKETGLWQTVLSAAPVPTQITATFGLLAVFFIFIGAYFATITLMKKVGETKTPVKILARNFIVSIIPIGIAYTMAHYFALLFISGQSIIALISDPFGLGANIFGTADYSINVGLIGAKALWYIQLGFVLGGHMLGVYIGHLIAVKEFKTMRLAIKSQYPVLVLMILLTSFALYILSAQNAG